MDATLKPLGARTQQWTRAYLEGEIAGEVARSARGHGPFSLLHVEIDGVAEVARARGRALGERIIAAAAEAIASSLRGYDICSRWDGCEILVLLPETTPEHALATAERLRERVAAMRVEEPALVAFTASIGVACYRTGEPPATMFQRAEEALFEARRRGRDRVCTM